MPPEPTHSFELGLTSLTAHSHQQGSLSDGTDTLDYRMPVSHRSPNWPRKCLNTTVLCCLGLGISIALLFVLLFVAIPKLSRTPPIIIPVPPSTDRNETPGSIAGWLDEFPVMPVMCHSHNDYLRPRPLVTALMAGCTGIEADVWLDEDSKDLLVGHDRAALTSRNSLRSMYLDPLLALLDSRNPVNMLETRSGQNPALGVFKGSNDIPVVLMIDVKENATAIWNIVLQQLQPFREKGYLRRYENGTVWPGPLVVVGSGELQLDTLVTSFNGVPYYDYHDTFLDAPLGEVFQTSTLLWTHTYNASNSYYASVSFNEAIGSVAGGFSEYQLHTLRRQIQVARAGGLYSRYWGTPEWPVNYRDYLWTVLTKEGVGILSVDDVDSAAKQSWTTNYMGAVDGMIATSCILFAAVVLFAAYGVFKNRCAAALLARHTDF